MAVMPGPSNINYRTPRNPYSPTATPQLPYRYSPIGAQVPNRGGGPLTPISTPGSMYNASLEQTGEDYSNIMKRFADVADSPTNQNSQLMSEYRGILDRPTTKYGDITPESYNYKRSDELGRSLTGLENLSQTGGFSAEDIANLRARGISPIRSVYANAQRNLDRSRALSGGYSPNYGAASAKMARDLSEQIAGQTQNVNANIAEMVASGRREMAPQFASAAGAESELANRYGSANVEARNRANESNREFRFRQEAQDRADRLKALEGMTGLESSRVGTNLEAAKGMLSTYGATPGLANTFGNQAAEQARIREQARARSQQAGSNLVSNYMRNRRTILG